MAVERSRSADPIGDAPHGAAMGTWGLWLTIVVLAMFVAGLATAALYLETGHAQWPPEGFVAPGRGLALLAVVLTAVASAAATWALRRMRSARRRFAALNLAWGGAALVAAVVVLVADLAAAGFRWDAHAYTSVYWVLTGFAITFIGVGIIIVAAVLIQALTGLVDEHRHLELTNATIYVWFVFASTAVLLALVHLLPAVGRGGGGVGAMLHLLIGGGTGVAA